MRNSSANRDASQWRDAGAATHAVVPEAEASCGITRSQCDGELGTANPAGLSLASRCVQAPVPRLTTTFIERSCIASATLLTGTMLAVSHARR
jgi:hypothetical protein